MYQTPPSTKAALPQWIFASLLVVVLASYLPGLWVDLQDNDSAHHATIALNMYQQSDPISLVSHGTPYLDKPHFQFWLLYLSYHLMGVTTLAYKLSSFISTLIALLATYKLAKHLYNTTIAQTATLILSSSLAFMMANTDVRMDAILTGAVITAIWQVTLLIDKGKITHVIAAAIATAIAFSTKGWIGVGIIGLYTLSYLWGAQRLKQLIERKFLLLYLLFGICIIPEIYAFYVQYDLHPELIIRGSKGHSGVQFILWDHLLGRMSGANFGTTAEHPDYFFFFHTLLWAILPWGLLFYIASLATVRKQIQLHLLNKNSNALLLPIWVSMIALGVSKFQLPHYLNPLFPLCAILIAQWVDQQTIANKPTQWIQYITYIVMIGAMILLHGILFPATMLNLLFIIIFAILLIRLYLQSNRNIVVLGTLTGALFWWSFTLSFYPQLLSYQAGTALAYAAKQAQIPNESIYFLNNEEPPFSFDFYSGYIHPLLSAEQLTELTSQQEAVYMVVTPEQRDILSQQPLSIDTIATHRDYRVTEITATFLNPKTRESLLSELQLIRLHRHPERSKER